MAPSEHGLQLASDVRYMPRFVKSLNDLKQLEKDGFNTARIFMRTAAKDPTKDAIVFEGRALTFAQVDELSNKVAHWAIAQGLKFDDCIALLMENRPEYIIWWLGLTKIGVRIALINTNLRGKGLLHCLTVVKTAWLVAGTELVGAAIEIAQDLKANGTRIALSGAHVDADVGVQVDAAVAAMSSAPPPPAILNRANMDDVFGYIYTSGTTGLPKAAIIRHWRMFAYGAAAVNCFLVLPTDRVYCALPLYHSAGGAFGAGMMTYGGATFVIRRKFSASQFWQDVAANKCTVIQYIGELCRYLLAAPPSPFDRKHSVRIAIGNGLRPDIWGAFQDRFAIPEIGEFYGSTEGNISFVNHATTLADRGACGRQGWVLRRLFGPRIVKFDVEKEEPIRDKNAWTVDPAVNGTGFCIECAPGEAGELLGPISTSPTSRFEGYTDSKANSKKLLTDVFVKGDKYVRTGDLLTLDRQGYYRFVDRIGDTFRWKGENVSTLEVAETLSVFPGIKEANVYGVSIPGKDGRACMAACVLADDLSWPALGAHLQKNLPSYAVPIFVRKLKEIEVTGTFKHTKVALRDEGFDLGKVRDPIFWLNPATRQYEPFGQNEFRELMGGKAKL